jgi:hypothetical protein
MLRRVALVRTDVSEKRSAPIIRLTRIGVCRLLVTANVVPSSPILVNLILEALRSPETLVLIRATRCNIPEDGIFRSHRRGNLKSYTSSFDRSVCRKTCQNAVNVPTFINCWNSLISVNKYYVLATCYDIAYSEILTISAVCTNFPYSESSDLAASWKWFFFLLGWEWFGRYLIFPESCLDVAFLHTASTVSCPSWFQTDLRFRFVSVCFSFLPTSLP